MRRRGARTFPYRGGGTVPATPTGFPDASTTGVPSGTTLTTYSGPATISTPGTVIEDKIINMGLTVAAGANDVIIRRCKINGAGYYWAVLSDSGATGLQILDCEISGGGDSCVSGGNYTLKRCNISNAPDGVKAGSNCVVEDNWIHDLVVTAESHNDGIQTLGTTSLVIRHNRIVLASGANAAIILSTNAADQIRNVLIDNNLLGGGGWTVYGGNETTDAASKVSNITISNNKFTTAIFPKSGAYGPITSSSPPIVTVTGNVWYDGPNVGQEVT